MARRIQWLGAAIGGAMALCGALAFLLTFVPGGASAAVPRVRYYLALGDSLSQGQQPDAQGITLNTDEGYPNQLFTIEHGRIPGLTLVKFGCGGETTGSMISGRGNHLSEHFHCRPAGGSQLRAAELFLRAHDRPGQVPLVTIDIGANNVDGCVSVPLSRVATCVSAGEAAIKHDLPIIVRALRRAAPAGTRFAGMTLYDSALGAYFSASSSARALAAASVPLAHQINTDLATGFKSGGFAVADVAGAFDSYDTTHTVTWEGQSIPVNVARVCSWSWACTTPPSGPNIHPNKNGYAVIAGAFEKAIGRL